jgi:hypothetical protein
LGSPLPNARTYLAVEHGFFLVARTDYQIAQKIVSVWATRINPLPYTLSCSTPLFRSSFFPFPTFRRHQTNYFDIKIKSLTFVLLVRQWPAQGWVPRNGNGSRSIHAS